MVRYHIEEVLSALYNVGRGQRSKVTGNDEMCMVTKKINIEGHWDILAKVFKMKGPNFYFFVSRLIILFQDMFKIYSLK